MTIPDHILNTADLSKKPAGVTTLEYLTAKHRKVAAKDEARAAKKAADIAKARMEAAIAKQHDQIRANFNSMPPSHERTEYYRQNRHILGLR